MDVRDNENNSFSQDNEVGIDRIEDNECCVLGSNNANINNVYTLDFADDKDLVCR